MVGESLVAGDFGILVVDDNAENLRLLSQMLSERGYRVRVANSGRRALQSVQSNAPDLILLDIMMPDMNGYRVCEELKADEAFQDIPVIFVSALGEALDKVRAFSSGGVDYVTKPFQIKEVLARVRTHLFLHSLQKDLERQVAELNAFAHTVAHDIKSPLSVLVGYGDILADDSFDLQHQELKDIAEAIVKSGRRVSNIVDELLLLSSVHQMQEVKRTALDMTAIVRRVQERLEPLIQESQSEITVPPTWPMALGYGPWIEEVWVNYLSNAIKYGGCPDEDIPPRVELGFDDLASDGMSEMENPFTGASVRFWVRDNGPGIAPEQQGQLFTEFTRLHQVRAQGHGLGLSIVQRVVEKLGGQVGVESDLGEGSLFYFILPAAFDG
jgi:signal transduction histidine kinase